MGDIQKASKTVETDVITNEVDAATIKAKNKNIMMYKMICLYIGGVVVGLYGGIEIGIDFHKNWSVETIIKKQYVSASLLGIYLLILFLNAFILNPKKEVKEIK